jgi:4-amino-4-deoxy-L-arabinose transferase-like glycosyltransferase
VLFFSIPRSKLLGYILVAVPPIAALCAKGLVQYAGTGEGLRRCTARFLAGAVAVCAVLLAGTMFYERNNVRRLFADVRPLIAAGDTIVALHTYPFSLPFYLRLRQPVGVVEDWDRVQLLHKDTWRKELSDAGTFADTARARAILLTPAEFTRRMACARDHALFIIAEERVAADYPEVARLPRVASFGRYAVWQSRPTPAETEACGM